jgi:peptide/nickel transport system substrate-binding protein
MNSRRLKILWMPLAVVTAAATVAACSSSPSSSGGKGGGNSNATFTTFGYTTTLTPGAPMNPFAATNNIFPGYDTMELGWLTDNPADPNQELPGLASSWTVSPSGNQVTVHLQSGAKWSNGQPVTATDVKDSAAIWIAVGAVADLGSVTVVNPTTVTFNELAGQTSNTFPQIVGDALGTSSPNLQAIVPASEYGKLLPANIWATIATSQGTGAGAKAAATTLAGLAKTIAAYAPATDISAGPFYIKRLNTSEALLVKNPDFYAASKINVGQVVMEHFSTAADITALMQSGTLDYAPSYAPTKAEVSQDESAGYTELTGDGQVAAALVPNESIAPYNNIDVRQALAYILNRPAIQQIGEPVVGTPSTTITGAISDTLSSYLSSQQQSALNSYAPDAAKATSLLQSAGLTKKNGAWYLSNGKPWTINLPVPSGFSDWLAASSAIKAELDSFGIPTTITGEGQWPNYQPTMFGGAYPVGWWLAALSPDDYTAFGRIYGMYDGYNTAGQRYPAGDSAVYHWINQPATVTVPGLGTVNPGQLTAQLNTLNLNSAAGLAQQKQIGAKLIQTINYEVPILQLWDYESLQFTTTKRFTNWPTNAQVLSTNPGVWMAEGYVQPK